jgi:hypothetical protein
MAALNRVLIVIKTNKKMKSLIIILTLAIVSSVQCQTANIITPTEFDNIEINGNTLKNIKNTLGKQNAIEGLFGIPNSKTIDPDGEFYHYEFSGFSIGFSSIISEGTFERPILGGFQIFNSIASITIKGVNFTIGDNISVLGYVVFNTMNDNKKSIVYMYCEGCNNYISVRFDQTTKIITEIYYIEQT